MELWRRYSIGQEWVLIKWESQLPSHMMTDWLFMSFSLCQNKDQPSILTFAYNLCARYYSLVSFACSRCFLHLQWIIIFFLQRTFCTLFFFSSFSLSAFLCVFILLFIFSSFISIGRFIYLPSGQLQSESLPFSCLLHIPGTNFHVPDIIKK